MVETLNANEPQRIVFLKRTERSLLGAESYLKKRGWDVTTTTDLKKLLMLAVQKKPPFVFIAMDHANHKVIGLPKVLSQVIDSFIIPYIESQSSAAMMALRQMGSQYSLSPPISGPKIERLVNRIILDQQRKANAQEQSSRSAGEGQKNQTQDQVVSIRGSRNKSGEYYYQDKGNSTAQAPVYYENDYETGGPQITGSVLQFNQSESGEHLDREPTMEDIRGALKNMASGSLADGFSTNGSLPSHLAHLERLPNETDQDYENRIYELEKKNYQERTQKAYEEAYWNDLEAAAHEQAIERTGNADEEGYSDEDLKAALARMAELGVAPPPGIDLSLDGNQIPDFKRMKMELTKRRDFQRQKMEQLEKTDLILKGGKSTTRSEIFSVLEAGTKHTLDEVYVSSRKKVVENEIKKTAHAACIEVRSERFSGLLVAAMANATKFDEKFITFVKDKLKEFLKKSGETFTESDNMDLKLQEVEFNDWALKQADFLRRSVYEGHEIALAFFPVENLGKDLGESRNTNMVSMGLDEIRGDHPVEFDLYVYLPVNDRYVLYTQQGQVFGENQKTRLVARGIDKIHLPKTAEKDVKRYRVQNFLNDKIKAYKNPEKASA